MSSRLLWLSFAALSVAASACSLGGPSDKVVKVKDDDPEMEAAIATARSKLPEFWKAFDNPGPDDTAFALKVEIKDGEQSEHFWANELERKDGKVFGTINNEPNLVKSVKFGQRVEIPEDRTSDWTYTRGDKMVGNFTLRVLLKQLPKKEADALRARLAEP